MVFLSLVDLSVSKRRSILSGMTPLAANITSTVALFPGQITSGFAGRRLVSGAGRLPFRGLFAISVLGGACGGLLLLNTPSTVFAHLVPWLVLFATSAFAWGSFFRRQASASAHLGPVGAALAQFAIDHRGASTLRPDRCRVQNPAVGRALLAAAGRRHGRARLLHVEHAQHAGRRR